MRGMPLSTVPGSGMHLGRPTHMGSAMVSADPITRGRRDPAWWVKTVLGKDLWTVQREILESIRDNRETVVRSCHSMGKSFTAATAALWYLCNHPKSLVITTAPTNRQVRGILWKEIRALHRDALYPLGGKMMQQQFTLGEDWWAWGFTAPDYDPDRFQGFHAASILVLIDEAAGVSPLIYEAIDSILSGQGGRLLHVGNPTEEGGSFGQAFKLDAPNKFKVSAFDTPNLKGLGITLEHIRSGEWGKIPQILPAPHLVTPQWVSDKYKRWGENDPRWQSRVMAEFPSSGDDALVPLSWIESAQERWLDLEEKKIWSPEITLGLDVARFGDDETVISISHLQGIREFRIAKKQDTMETCGMLLALWDALDAKGWPVRTNSVTGCRVDADGLGAGVFDRLKEQGRPVIEMRNGARSRDPARFFNTRSEWLWQIREDLDPKGPNPMALPQNEDLVSQLTAIKWGLTSSGQIRIESKADMKKRIGRSPDLADAVAYARARLKTEAETVFLDSNLGAGMNQWEIH